MNSTRILVVDEKHGTYYYDISTDELWALACLDILTRRWNDGFWYQEGDEEYDEIKRIVETQDATLTTFGGKRPRVEPVAWKVLSMRSDYEYEHVSIESAERAEPREQS